MAGLPPPPGGFGWVEPVQPPRPDLRGNGGSGSRRRWAWLAATLVLAVVAGGVVAVLWWPRHRGESPADAPREALIGTPKELLLPFSLTREPVPGWRITGAEIGLPEGIEVGDLFARRGDKAYFVAHDGCNTNDVCNGWVYGLDTTSGARLFPPLHLDRFYGGGGSCHTNGPSTAVCATVAVMPDLPPSTVWVIDLDHGVATFSGPSTFNMPGGPMLEEVGEHLGQTRLVATVHDKGVYGVGEHAELTWFVPGTGQVETPNYLAVDDIPPLTMAVQPNANADTRDRVFSVVDGRDLTPPAPRGIRLEEAVVYNGGFAYQFSEGTKLAGTIFFDSTGREVGRQQPQRGYPQQNSAMPIILVGDTFEVYTAAGRLVAKIPAADQVGHFRTIGTKLYIRSPGYGDVESWQQWDLLTGQPGPTCQIGLAQEYVASDGLTIVSGDSRSSGQYRAVDSQTCRTQWETAENVHLWKVGNGLIQSSADAITALRPPA